MQLVLVRLDPFGQELRAVLLRALDQERDADRQLAGHRLPGPAGLDEGHHLPLVVAGAARGDHLRGRPAGSRSSARRAASPRGPAGRPAARRNGRRTARAAWPAGLRVAEHHRMAAGLAQPMPRRRVPRARPSATRRPCGNRARRPDRSRSTGCCSQAKRRSREWSRSESIGCRTWSSVPEALSMTVPSWGRYRFSNPPRVPRTIGAADRGALAAADGPAELRGQAADRLVHDRAGDLPGDRLAAVRVWPLLAGGAEDAADHVQDAARARLGRLGVLRAPSRRASPASRRPIPGRSTRRTCRAAGSPATIRRRSAGSIGPTWAIGGAISVRSTIEGAPLPSSVETSASPTPSSVIAFSVSKAGFCRKVSAATRTAFWSRGVKARSACWTRLPSCDEHRLGHVDRVLRDEVDADALRADQAHDALDRLDQRLRRVVEQEMRLVEEEDELRLVEVADLRQLLEQLRHQPQQEGRVEARVVHQLVGGKDVDDAAPVPVRLHQVLDVERRLAEELVALLVLEDEELALDRADRGLRHVAVGRRQLPARSRR